MLKCTRLSLLAFALLSLDPLGSRAFAQAPDLAEIVRNPVIGNYKGYAEFKMGHYEEARVIWEALAQRGNREAHFNLGILHEDGLGVAQSMPQAVGHYERSAEAGSSKAQYRLGLLYSVGAKLPRDDARAKRWLTAAAAQGDKDAALLLAMRADGPQTPREQDFLRAETHHASGQYAQAATIWTRLAQDGDTRSRTRLAAMLEAGQGVARSLEQAAQLFRQSAEDGDADAQYAVAVMLQTGQGQALDPVEASIWLRRAAAQGHGPATAAQRQDALTGTDRTETELKK